MKRRKHNNGGRSMNMGMYGDDLFKKRLDKFESEIKEKYSGDKEDCEFRLMKAKELRLFGTMVWLEMKKGFALESPWYYISDTDSGTTLAKVFTDEEDMQPVAFKDTPDTAAIIALDTDTYSITFMIGLERCAEITILGSNAVNFACSDDKFRDKPIYQKIINIVSSAHMQYSNAPDPSESSSDKKASQIVTSTIADTVKAFVESAEDDEKFRRMAFMHTIGRIEQEFIDCVDGGWSDWFDMTSSDGRHFYSKLWLNKEDEHYLVEGFDTKNTPPNIIVVIFSMDYLVIDVSIGTNGLVRFSFDENGGIKAIFNSKFDHPAYDTVYEKVQNIISERE